MPISVAWVIDTAIGRPAWTNSGTDSGRSRASRLGRVDAPERAVDRAEPRAAREIFRRAAFVLDHVRFAVAEGDAARLVGERQRQRIGGRAGADEEHRDLALEDLVELFGDRLVEVAVAIGRREAGAMRGERRRRPSDARRPSCRKQKS